MFQSSGDFHVLHKIKIWYFQKKSILDLNALKPLSFVGGLQRFFYIEVKHFEFLVLIEML